VSAPSAEVLQAVKDYYGFDLSASRVIPNPLAAAAESETWGVKNRSNPSLLFVGRFDRRKGGDLILRVFAELAASDPRLCLTFVGPDRASRKPTAKCCFSSNSFGPISRVVSVSDRILRANRPFGSNVPQSPAFRDRSCIAV